MLEFWLITAATVGVACLIWFTIFYIIASDDRKSGDIDPDYQKIMYALLLIALLCFLWPLALVAFIGYSIAAIIKTLPGLFEWIKQCL